MGDPNRLLLELTRLQRKLRDEGLTVEELERSDAIRKRLDRHFSCGSSARTEDRRQSPRVPTRLRCSFESLGIFERALITNLSHGGVFIKTVSPLPIGSKLRICIRIAKTEAEIELPGVVVWHNLGPCCDTLESGMGVAFEASDSEIVEQINKLFLHASRCAADGESEQRPPTGEKPRRD
jgi:uncharacterized protein (TIGR02266 family)